jgi:putative LysE/RhtB family amino acid efflux pump
MSIFIVYLKSILIGLAIAAPVGPIGLLCIRSVLSSGFRVGIAAGLGAALADTVYGFIAALGLSAITVFLMSKITIIKILGGVFLLYLGFKESRSRLPLYQEVPVKRTIVEVMGSTFFLTLTSPITILSFVGVFSSLGDTVCYAPIDSAITVFGIFTGSMLWWLILCSIIKYTHCFLPAKALRLITLTSSVTLIAFGFYTCLSILVNYLK